MKVCKIMRVECFVVNSDLNEQFENVLAMMMVPVKAFDPDKNTYTIHVTWSIWKYLMKECGYRDITVMPQEGFKRDIVNMEAFREYKNEKKQNK